MSRLAATKEFTFMRALRDAGFAVPEPLALNRHTIVMELIDAFPLRQIKEVPDPPGLYAELMEMIMHLAGVGLIHGDFNEFNILIKEGEKEEVESAEQFDGALASASARTETRTPEGGGPIPTPTPTPTLKLAKPKTTTTITLTPVLIDFPQMVSVSHANAEMYFDRDVDCIKRFFARRFGFRSDDGGPYFADAKKLLTAKNAPKRLDVAVEASGFSKKMAKELDAYMREMGVDGDGNGVAEGGGGRGGRGREDLDGGGDGGGDEDEEEEEEEADDDDDDDDEETKANGDDEDADINPREHLVEPEKYENSVGQTDAADPAKVISHKDEVDRSSSQIQS